MTGNRSLRAHSQYYLRLYFAHASSEVPHRQVQIQSIELAVGVLEYLRAADVEYLAGGSQFCTAKLGKFFVGSGASPVCCRLPRSKADQECFNPARPIQRQSSTKSADLIVGMSRNAE